MNALFVNKKIFRGTMKIIPDSKTGASGPVKRQAFFNLAPELKETVLRLAEIRYEEKRRDPFSGKDESYFKKMKNRLICDYCNDIAAQNSPQELQVLAAQKKEQLQQLENLRKQPQQNRSHKRTASLPQHRSVYDHRPLTHFEPVTGIAHTTKEVHKAFQKLLDR